MRNKITFLILIAFTLFSCQRKKQEVALPNVLFILVDDYGYTDCSVMGSKYYETPNIDRIAHEGMIFTDGYATCQVCSPSRASILSGKFPARHGITDWIGAATGEDWSNLGRATKLLPPEYVHHLQQSYTTLPEALKEAGYTTFFAGKWHLGKKGSWPEDHGFDINKGGWDVGSPIGGYFSPWQNPNLPSGPDGENLTMRLAKETVNFIQEHKDTAFFAYLSFYAVHGPIQTTKEKWEKYRDKAEVMGIAETGFEMGHFLPIRQHQDNPIYAGLVESTDDAVGYVLDALDELGLTENTIICFTGDNGGVAAGDAFATSNKPLRGGKGYQFEGGIREPFFIKVPELGNGLKCNTPVTGTDFYPTILELCGADLKPEEHTDGVSLVPLLKGQSLGERPLIWHYPHYGNQGGEPSSIIRLGEWKLIHYYEDGHEELYNLEYDLSETNDLAAENPEKVKEISLQLFEMLKEMGARFPRHDPTWTAEREKAHRQNIIDKKWPALEKERLWMLSEDFDPGNDWWGSKITTD
ncbi:sulfatase [uncultured Draconibacterium sp.]|uniref:sulfatase n=1 Tax=uncultured Draconibacterium sp. TaxID=1573823 RepID=UPI002AA895AD|nr:sulfatase [uncultured Draconibacterium sp.]